MSPTVNGTDEQESAAAGVATTGALDTAVIIVNYRTKQLTRDAVASVLREPEVKEVLIVDNASGDGSAEHLRTVFAGERVRVLDSDRNRGFGPAVNLAAKQCDAPLMLILNSDATLAPQSLGRLARALVADDAIGVVAPAVYEIDARRLQPGAYGPRLPNRRDILLGNGWARNRDRNEPRGAAPGWVSGVAMLLRRDDFLGIGGFDEGFDMYFEDLDLCRRLHGIGKSVRRDASAAVVHSGGKSWQSRREQKLRFHRSKLRYYEKLGATRLELAFVRVAGAIRTSLVPRSR